LELLSQPVIKDTDKPKRMTSIIMGKLLPCMLIFFFIVAILIIEQGIRFND